MFLRILMLFIVLTFVSCSSDDDTQLAELNANRELWESHQIENYNWLETLSCECNIPLKRTIFVVNNVKTEVIFDESLLFGNTPQDIFDTSNTVNEAFDFIKSIIGESAISLAVEYDETYGFPTKMNVLYTGNAIEDFIDDNIVYRYTNFEVTN